MIFKLASCLVASTVLWRVSLAAFVQDALVDQLLNNYKPYVKPAPHNTKIIVTLDLWLKAVETTGQDDNRVVVTFMMLSFWKDHNLQWFPEQYGGLECLFISENKIWTPDVGLFVGRLWQEMSISESSPKVHLCHNGEVTKYTWVRAAVVGNFDMSDYPFDTQEVNFTLASALANINEIDLRSAPNSYTVNNTNAQPNEEWEISAEGCYRSVLLFDLRYPFYIWPRLECKLTLKRHPIFHIYIFYMPNMIVTLLLICGIFTRSTSTGQRLEKFRLGLHAMLAFVVAMNVLSETVPHSPKGIPLISRIYFSLMFVAFFSTLISWIEIKLEQFGLEERPVPRCLAWSLIYLILPEHHYNAEQFLEAKNTDEFVSRLEDFIGLCRRVRQNGCKEAITMLQFMEVVAIFMKTQVQGQRKTIRYTKVARFWLRLANLVGRAGFMISFATWLGIGAWVLTKYIHHVHN